MAFVEYQPTTVLKRGQCNIGKTGWVSLCYQDLAAIDACGAVSLLIDDKTKRLALTKPVQGCYSLAVHYEHNVAEGRGRIFIRRAIERIGLTARIVAGRYDLEREGDKFVITLTDRRKD